MPQGQEARFGKRRECVGNSGWGGWMDGCWIMDDGWWMRRTRINSLPGLWNHLGNHVLNFLLATGTTIGRALCLSNLCLCIPYCMTGAVRMDKLLLRMKHVGTFTGNFCFWFLGSPRALIYGDNLSGLDHFTPRILHGFVLHRGESGRTCGVTKQNAQATNWDLILFLSTPW